MRQNIKGIAGKIIPTTTTILTTHVTFKFQITLATCKYFETRIKQSQLKRISQQREYISQSQKLALIHQLDTIYLLSVVTAIQLQQYIYTTSFF